MFNTEEEFAEVIVKWLKKEGWEVYQEVQTSYAGSIADIVAKKDDKYWIIECKLNFGFTVLSQTYAWRNFAHYVSVAIPFNSYSPFKRIIAEKLNVGILTVSRDWYKDEFRVNNQLMIEQELKHKSVINTLTEKHKTFAKAGNSSGQRLTPFSLTVEKLTELVKSNEGILLKEAIKKINHHYAHDRSANNCLSSLINDGTIKELRIERTKEGNRVYYEQK